MPPPPIACIIYKRGLACGFPDQGKYVFPPGTASLPILSIVSISGYYDFFELRTCPHSHSGLKLFALGNQIYVTRYYVLQILFLEQYLGYI